MECCVASTSSISSVARLAVKAMKVLEDGAVVLAVLVVQVEDLEVALEVVDNQLDL